MPDEPQFSNEHFMSRAEKRKVLRAWTRFLKSGCSKAQFTEALYHHLIQHCSFIAHYDRQGFYHFYFEQIDPSLFRFFDQFDPQQPGTSAEYGTTHWLSQRNTGSDLNHAMREIAGPYLQSLRQRFDEVRRQRSISLARLLLSAYGLAVVPANHPAMAREKSATAQSTTAPSIQQDLFIESGSLHPQRRA